MPCATSRTASTPDTPSARHGHGYAGQQSARPAALLRTGGRPTKKAIIGGIAAIAIGLAAAPVAGADPGYSSADLDFIAAVSHEPPGYYGDPDRLIKTGNVVCGRLDDGANWQTVEAEIIIHHGAGWEGYAGYNAAIFKQYAIVHLCPRHSDKLSVI
jgi:hypothetical protein